jgi:CheY-like chemotaxis protein
VIKKLFLVDDDQDDIDLFAEAMQCIDKSIELSTAINGEDALKKLARTETEIIFLDINMPKMDGWDCLMNIRRNDRLKDTPVIMFSTSSTCVSVTKAIRSGAAGYLEKPNSYVKLRDFLEELCKASQSNLLDTMRSIELAGHYNFSMTQ